MGRGLRREKRVNEKGITWGRGLPGKKTLTGERPRKKEIVKRCNKIFVYYGNS